MTDEQRDSLTTVLGFFLFALFNAVAIAVGAYFFFEFSEIYDSLNKDTDEDYFSIVDLGYSSTKIIDPIELCYIVAIPEIWEQIGTQVIISSSIYAAAAILGFVFFMPVDLFVTSVYIHYLIYLLKKVELDPNANLLQIVLLEQQSEMLYFTLLMFDIALAAAGGTIVFIVGVSLFAKHTFT